MGREGLDVAYDGVQVVDVLQDSLEIHEVAHDVAYVGVANNSVECSGQCSRRCSLLGQSPLAP